VLPLLHPANCVHSPDSMPQVLDDYLTLGRLLDGEITFREDDPYRDREDYEDFAGRRLIVDRVSGCDTEGSVANPWCATISSDPGTATIIKPGQVAEFRNLVYLHNSLHDLGVLRKMGIHLGEDQFIDTMVLAYLLVVEPQALKSLAYRHCGAERKSYDEMVSPAQEEISQEYLLNLLAHADQFPIPEPRVIYKAGKPKVYKPQAIDKRVTKILVDFEKWKSGGREEPVDLRDRWNKIDEELKLPVIEVLGDMRHADLSDIDYQAARTYACHDSSDTLRIGPVLQAKIKSMELEEAARVDHAILPCIDRMQEVGIGLAPPAFWDDIEEQCDKQMSASQWKIFEITGHDINPASGDQVAELLYGHDKGQLGLIPPRLTDSGTRGAVDATTLEQLLAAAPVVQHVMDYTEANKIKGTYVEPLRRLARKGDRAHSTMRVTRTTTGRLSMADPPLHQIPILTDIGKQLRNGFIPANGNVLGDWDLNQIEMRLMAHESKDEDLCRMFIEGRDVHSETACKIFSIPMGQLSVNSSGKVNDVRRTVAKHAGFGIINGITEHGLVNYMILNRCRRPDGESWTLDDCVMLLKEWFNVYPGVKRFQKRCIAEAQQTGLSRESISGRIIYLPQVWSPNKKVRESAERMSYVQHTQGGAAALFKKALKAVWDFVKKMDGVEPIMWVHDEVLCELPDEGDTRQAMDLLVRGAMETTVKLRVPVLADGGFGMSWGQAH
jgi:DNA polymerase I-like protein with 3'-5' exonuclease and polymerase domains